MTRPMELHFATIWEALADAIPDQPALVHGPVRRSWQAFDDRAARLAGALRDVGLGPGSVVALYLYNGPEYLEAFFACLKIRAVPCNVNYRYLEREVAYLLDDSDAEAIVFHSSLAPRVERALAGRTGVRLAIEVVDGEAGRAGGIRLRGAHAYEDLATGAPVAERIHRPGDDHYLFYTGGTTGLPKGVIRTLHPTVERLVRVFPARLGLGEHERPETLVASARSRADSGRQPASIPAAPLMHHTGLGLGATPALTAGGRVILLTGRRFDADELWDTVERERVDALAIVGDAFARPML
ncbi:MAG TPA: AMP-binding protein, partial [Acidimicrobiales bacterium]